MSVIKNMRSGWDGVRALDARAPQPPLSAEELRIRALLAEIEELESAIRDNDAKHVEALAAARMGGRAEAECDFLGAEAARRKAVEAALADARAAIDARLGQAETLALVFACAALEHLIADPERRVELISGAIERQVRGLRQGTLLSLAVSHEDFSDASALAVLACDERVAITIDASLASGVCRLRLRLGEVDISLPRFVEDLRACCAHLAAGA